MPSATICNSRNGGMGCDRPVLAKGLCSSHYMKEIRGRDPHEAVRGYGQKLKELNLRLPPDVLETTEKEAARLNVSAYVLRRLILETWLADEAFQATQSCTR